MLNISEITNQLVKIKDKEPDSIKIKFYKNGFKLGTLKYFSYVSKEAHNILKDIIDGFFPGFLKNVYPEGIIINWVNKSYKTYEYATAKVMNLNIGGGFSPYGPLADSEDDIDKDMQQEVEKKKKAKEDKKMEKNQSWRRKETNRRRKSKKTKNS